MVAGSASTVAARGTALVRVRPAWREAAVDVDAEAPRAAIVYDSGALRGAGSNARSARLVLPRARMPCAW
jgi:hypothetical protein